MKRRADQPSPPSSPKRIKIEDSSEEPQESQSSNPQSEVPSALPSTRDYTFVFDPLGDLCIAAKEEKTNITEFYLVKRALLCSSSPVFEAMMGKDSRFKESRENCHDGVHTIRLEEDSLLSINLYLLVIHEKDDWIPKKLCIRVFQALADFCDKYDLGDALEKHAEVWIRPHCSRIILDCAEWLESTLYIAASLKLHSYYESLMRYLINRLHVGEGGYLMLGKRALDTTQLSRTLIVELFNCRYRAILGMWIEIAAYRCVSIEQTLQTDDNSAGMEGSEDNSQWFASQLESLNKSFPDINNPTWIHGWTIDQVLQEIDKATSTARMGDLSSMDPRGSRRCELVKEVFSRICEIGEAVMVSPLPKQHCRHRGCNSTPALPDEKTHLITGAYDHLHLDELVSVS